MLQIATLYYHPSCPPPPSPSMPHPHHHPSKMAFIVPIPIPRSSSALLSSRQCIHPLTPSHPIPSSTPFRRSLHMDLPSTGVYNPSTPPSKIRAIIFGATGYIGRVVVEEFLAQGYQVTAFARPRSGVSGSDTEETVRDSFPGADVVFGDVTKADTIGKAFENLGDEGSLVVSCLASRSGGVQDSRRIDYQATSDVLNVAREYGVNHFVLLSAICVQKPELEFQKAKLKFEEELSAAAAEDGEFSYAIVRPTAFFKSLAAQVERMKKGSAYVMFGEGDLSKCNALSERDLARFIVLCAREEGKRNCLLPVGGPGKAVTPREQAEIVFKMLGREPRYVKLPIGIMDGVNSILSGLSKVLPFLEDTAEFGKIGRYYAVEDMVGPKFGEDTLEGFFKEALKDGGMKGQDLGAAKVF